MTELLEGLVIRFPARPGYLSISRLNVTAMAAGAGFDIEELDDLRLAIDEAVTWLVGDVPTIGTDAVESGADAGFIELDISCQPGRFECRVRRSVADHGDAELGDLVNAIFGATVDQFRVGRDASDSRYIDLVKRSIVDG